MEYEQITKELRLDIGKDRKSAELLNSLIRKADINQFYSIKKKCVIVFGAGPSLTLDIDQIKTESLQKECILIAADGAVKALLEYKLIPRIQVTDLDGDTDAIINANKRGTITVVHAHADNIDKIIKYVPDMENVVGTTQVKPFGKLLNFGGFTDGDRAVFLADHFKAGIIALAGMDFGSEIGEYSGDYNKEFKLKKLTIGKTLLENIAKKSSAHLVNLTDNGERIKGIPRISAKQLKVLSSHMLR